MVRLSFAVGGGLCCVRRGGISGGWGLDAGVGTRVVMEMEMDW